MTLGKYRGKRSFKDSSEPRGTASAKKTVKNDLIFVIQRHDATNLHYDFRLGMEGVLKSWAVPKGPSMNPSDKRLAMMVEDHPFDYATFEGEIPKGNYGAGLVEIWDKGTYKPLNKSDDVSAEKLLLEELKGGSLKIVLKGKKIRGEFALVKTKGMGENAWLLIKHRDRYATDESYNAEDHIKKSSKIPKGGRKKAGSGKSYPKYKPALNKKR